MNWLIDGHWMLVNGRHVFPVAAKFLPVPFIFILWVRLMERTEPFALSFSLVCCILSIEGFTAMQELVESPSAAGCADARGYCRACSFWCSFS